MPDDAATAGLVRDVRRAAQLDVAAWLDIAQAAAWLALARIRLRRDTARLLDASLDASTDCVSPPAEAEDYALIDRVAFAIPRVGARLPWRSDCLVQASAAKAWLRRRGIASHITIGVRAPLDDRFEAHAWLKVGDRVVTGGDISAFTAFSRGAVL